MFRLQVESFLQNVKMDLPLSCRQDGGCVAWLPSSHRSAVQPSVCGPELLRWSMSAVEGERPVRLRLDELTAVPGGSVHLTTELFTTGLPPGRCFVTLRRSPVAKPHPAQRSQVKQKPCKEKWRKLCEKSRCSHSIGCEFKSVISSF